MKFRKLGNKISWEPSALGLGTMRLPQKKKFGLFKMLDEKKAIELIQYSIDKGINYVDTAWGYHLGKSEGVVGQALQNGYREKVKLVTKLPMWKITKKEDFDYYLGKQLERLQTDHLDIYLFHTMNKKYFDIIKKLNLIEDMKKAKEEGKIRAIGFSFHDDYSVFKELVDYFDWDVCQIQLNYVDTEYQAGIKGLKYASSKGIGVIVMEPVRGGKLAKPDDEILQIMNIAKEQGIDRTPVDWALQFLWNMPEVGVVLSGMGSNQMLEENCASADSSGIGSLNKVEMKTIEQMSALYKKKILVPCTECQYCMPCPHGVNIPLNFTLLNNSTNKSLTGQSKKNFKKLATKKKKLNKDSSNGAAQLCVECGECLEKCPQKIAIPDELKRVTKILSA